MPLWLGLLIMAVVLLACTLMLFWTDRVMARRQWRKGAPGEGLGEGSMIDPRVPRPWADDQSSQSSQDDDEDSSGTPAGSH